ncbi:MAG TPA: hypothetical protein VMV25_12410 [Steroidobacteraceae bacterium]|nr:hypothetical protein [Steroidobacteraceae bacterium]
MQLAPAKSARRAAWLDSPERGSLRLLRLMVFVSMRLGRRISRGALYAIAAYFFLFAPKARVAARRYLGLALGRRPTAGDRFRHLLYFASTIHDRVFLLNDREHLFEISIDGAATMRAQLHSGRGAVLIGAHMGSFEVIGALARREPGLRAVMAMYEENAHKVKRIFSAINPAATPEIVALGRIDAMLQIAERLAAGCFVGILGDRTLGNEPVQAATLLGERAYLPTGPMRTAAILGSPVIFMAALYRGGNRYHVVFSPIADFAGVRGAARAPAVAAALARYAALLDACCRADPYNWFNFFDFWATRADRAEQ